MDYMDKLKGKLPKFKIVDKRLEQYEMIVEANLDRGDISFLIETEDGKFCRVKHRNLDLFYIYKS
jgi:hypothetical protein